MRTELGIAESEMMSGMEKNSKHSILDLIERLSPDTADFVRCAADASGIKVFYHDGRPPNQGVYCLVHWQGTNYAYASFMQEMVDIDILQLIESTIGSYIADKEPLCFNVYGRNANIVKCVRDLGFASDMEGFELAYQGAIPPEVPIANLVVRSFERSQFNEFVHLFEQAYYPLNKENGWPVDWYSNHKDIFAQRLEAKAQKNELRAFWNENALVGAYIVDTNYISDLVVHPQYQGLGYGKILLLHATKALMNQGETKPVCLRVAKSNQKAIRFYQKYHFAEIACFAEHTFPKE
ncbi:GNAT family N-acetyltransferase [Alicyclobacillus fodiniaquatilis]|uniref:GNAT family N-acetyltransferase n=1 Tax=Alicyclobacillus fodiniaquatilis TaxID=1661150 RepID=A0ABW4JN33_9BACL